MNNAEEEEILGVTLGYWPLSYHTNHKGIESSQNLVDQFLLYVAEFGLLCETDGFN